MINVCFYEFVLIARCAATTDFWTDKHRQRSYISLSVHYLTARWQLRRRVLFVAHYKEENKTGEAVRRMLIATAESIGISSNDFGKLIFVTDQGQNLVSGLSGNVRFNCIVHCLNLVLKHAFNQTENPTIDLLHNLIENAAVITKYVKKSGKMDDLPHPLLSAVSTRFNTNYFLLNSIRKNYDKLDEMFNISDPLSHNGNRDLTKRKSFFIAKELLTAVVPFLEQFNIAIKSLQYDTKPTFHEVPLWVCKFFPKLFRILDSDSEIMTSLKGICHDLFREKVMLYKENKFACVLNPDFRTLNFLSDEERNGVYSTMKGALREIENETESNAPVPELDIVNVGAWDEYKSVSNMDIDAEFNMYLQNANLKQASLLDWWAKHEDTFPRLSHLAKKLLAIPASNTTSERIFNAAGYTVSERRTGLSPNVIDKLMFLKSNINNE